MCSNAAETTHQHAILKGTHWLRPVLRKHILSDWNPNALIVLSPSEAIALSLVIDDNSPHHFICQLDSGWHRKLPSLVGWAISCDSQLQILSHTVMSLAWPQWARLDMCHSWKMILNRGLGGKNLEQWQAHLIASVRVWGKENLERFKSRHSSLEGKYLGSELCAASVHPSMMAGKTQKV